MRFLPAVVVWISTTLLYKLMPSTKVYWRAAAVAGALAAIALILVHGVYVRSQVGLAVNNTVYAALAAIPMLIIYLSLMWTIILAGVQVSFAVQNVNGLGPPAEEPDADTGAHMRLALALAQTACDEGCVELSEYARYLDVPPVWIDRVASDLVAAEVLCFGEGDGAEGGGEEVVRLARPAAEITMWDIVHAVAGHEGDRELQLPPEMEARLRGSMDAMRASLSDFALGKA